MKMVKGLLFWTFLSILGIEASALAQGPGAPGSGPRKQPHIGAGYVRRHPEALLDTTTASGGEPALGHAVSITFQNQSGQPVLHRASTRHQRKRIRRILLGAINTPLRLSTEDFGECELVLHHGEQHSYNRLDGGEVNEKATALFSGSGPWFSRLAICIRGKLTRREPLSAPSPSLPLPAAPALLPRPLPDKSPSAMQVVPHISQAAA